MGAAGAAQREGGLAQIGLAEEGFKKLEKAV